MMYFGRIHFKEIPEEDEDMYTVYVAAKDEYHALQLLAGWAKKEKEKEEHANDDVWLEVRDTLDFPNVLEKAYLEEVEPLPCKLVFCPTLRYDIIVPGDVVIKDS